LSYNGLQELDTCVMESMQDLIRLTEAIPLNANSKMQVRVESRNAFEFGVEWKRGYSEKTEFGIRRNCNWIGEERILRLFSPVTQSVFLLGKKMSCNFFRNNFNFVF